MSEIRKYFPDNENEPMMFLREYLQYEILKILFRSKYGPRFTFLGGTCLRICYGTNRFSEDLDFDNLDMNQEEFEEAGYIIQRGLTLLGYEVNVRFVYKDAFHCYIRFPALLYKYQLSGHKEAKLLIKMDTEKQNFTFDPAVVSLNKFGVQTDVRAVPLSLLGSQKIAAIMGRKRAKGRDYYDLAWILERDQLDYDYIEDRFGFRTPAQLRSLVLTRIKDIDFDKMAEDVRPFLMEKAAIESVRTFPAYWRTVPL